jgi:hypothetical protein
VVLHELPGAGASHDDRRQRYGDGIYSDCMKLAGRNRGGPSARQYPELHWGGKVLSGLRFTTPAYRQTSGMSRLGIYLWRRRANGSRPPQYVVGQTNSIGQR